MAKVRLTLEQEMVLREYREKSTRLFQELRAAVAASKELTHMQDNPDDEKVLMGGLSSMKPQPHRNTQLLMSLCLMHSSVTPRC